MPVFSESDQLLTLEEAGRILRRSGRQVRRYRGKLRMTDLGSAARPRLMTTRAWIAEFVERNVIPPSKVQRRHAR